jgi:hypothetical protein
LALRSLLQILITPVPTVGQELPQVLEFGTLLLVQGGQVQFNTCNLTTNYDSQIHMYTGTPGSLTCFNADDDGNTAPVTCNISLLSDLIVTTTLGTTYYVYINGFSSSVGDFELNITCDGGAPPATGLSFDGIDDQVDLGPINITGAISIEAWVKPSLKTNFLTILCTKVAGFNNPGFLFAINEFNTSSGKLVFETSDAAVISNVR